MSPVVPSAPDGTPSATEQNEDDPDDHQNDPQSPQDRDREQIPHYQQNYAKNNHDASRSQSVGRHI